MSFARPDARCRGRIHDEGQVLAFRDRFIFDCGAWNPVGAGIPYNTAVHLLGPYKIENFFTEGRICVTNKVPSAPYRGAGRPEAVLAMERVMDIIGAELNLEPADVRAPQYDSGERDALFGGHSVSRRRTDRVRQRRYPAALEKALAAVGGIDAFRSRQREEHEKGRYLGLGIGCYVEGTGVGPFESATVRIDPSGKIYVTSGACPQGQGMETIFAQIVADVWRVHPDDVIISLADTSAIAMGFGTIASRSTVTASAAMHYASEPLRERRSRSPRTSWNALRKTSNYGKAGSA